MLTICQIQSSHVTLFKFKGKLLFLRMRMLKKLLMYVKLFKLRLEVNERGVDEFESKNFRKNVSVELKKIAKDLESWSRVD